MKSSLAGYGCIDSGHYFRAVLLYDLSIPKTPFLLSQLNMNDGSYSLHDRLIALS